MQSRVRHCLFSDDELTQKDPDEERKKHTEWRHGETLNRNFTIDKGKFTR